MKKFLTLICAFVISLTACMGLVACGGNSGNGDKPTPPAPAKTQLTYSSMSTQYDAIAEVAGGAADIAVVEKAVFRDYYNRLVDESIMFISGDQFAFNTEEYVMATKKGTDVAEFINAALYHFQNEEITINKTNGNVETVFTLTSVAESFGFTASELITIQQPSISIEDVPESGSAFERILVDNFKIGFVTDVHKRELNNYPFAGNSHFGGDDGFEVMLMRAVARAYGLTVATSNTNFITYANREQALASGEVDVLIGGFSKEGWNGDFNFTVPYLTNSQVLVIRKADASKYATFAGMKDASFTAASGSIGETLIETGAIKTAVLG